MNLRQIKAIRKLFLAYGQPGTVGISPLILRHPKHHEPSQPQPFFIELKQVSDVKYIPVSTGYFYRVKVRTPDTSGWHGIHWVKCVDLTDLKNPKFAIHKEESANAPA